MSKTERTLTIFAHPDDIAWTCAGTVARMTIEGHEIDQIMVTSGGYEGDEKKKDQRLQEERESMNTLGIRELIPLDFPDGELSEEMFGDLVRAVLHVIDSAEQRGIVYTRLLSFNPVDGFSGHPDHKIVARAAEYAFRMRDQIKELSQIIMSPDERQKWPESWDLGGKQVDVPQPDIAGCRAVDISGTVFHKIRAIMAHGSQLDGDNGGLAQIQRVLSRSPGTSRTEYWRVYSRP